MSVAVSAVREATGGGKKREAAVSNDVGNSDCGEGGNRTLEALGSSEKHGVGNFESSE